MTPEGPDWGALALPAPDANDAPDVSLAEFMGYVDKPVKQDEHGLVLEDEPQTEWALRLYARYELDAARVDEQADNLIAHIEAWRRQRRARYQNKLQLFAGALQRFFFHWRGAHPREKSLPLVHGIIGEHAQQPEVQRDEPALVEWMKANDLASLVIVKESANWGALKKLCAMTGNHPVFLPTGESIDAVTLAHRLPSFYVKTSAQTVEITAADYAALPEDGEEAP